MANKPENPRKWYWLLLLQVGFFILFSATFECYVLWTLGACVRDFPLAEWIIVTKSLLAVPLFLVVFVSLRLAARLFWLYYVASLVTYLVIRWPLVRSHPWTFLGWGPLGLPVLVQFAYLLKQRIE